MTIPLVLVLTLLSSMAYVQGVPVAAQLSANVLAPKVSGTVNVNSPGGEAFWSQVTGVQIPLTYTNDYGGNTKSVLVKMATNGTHMLVLATWSDPTESRTKNNVIEEEANPGLFYANSSFFYEDRIVFWWSLDQNPGPPPCMTKSAEGHGEGESIAGTGNLWHWKAARTDSLGASFGKLKYGSGPNFGQALIPPHSYADNEYINSTGHNQLGYDQYPTASSPGNFTIGVGENNVPYNTFVVSAHGVYDRASHTWTWAAARALATTPVLHTVQFAQDKVYYFAIGTWDGGPIPIPSGVAHPAGWSMYGENEETKSISSWYTMALAGPQTTTSVATSSAATSPNSGAPVVSFESAALISFGLLVVGFVAGIILTARITRPKQ
ncbi:MAG: ethylbenzene dehydrogenase-related protein [Nitrososphaerales archaeon]|nr:ethylbenzene dehydrogenase-related protein [Nitrososphaerales archaeon]